MSDKEGSSRGRSDVANAMSAFACGFAVGPAIPQRAMPASLAAVSAGLLCVGLFLLSPALASRLLEPVRRAIRSIVSSNSSAGRQARKLLVSLLIIEMVLAASVLVHGGAQPITSWIRTTRSGVQTSLGVANVTRGDRAYEHLSTAKVDDVLKFQLVYRSERTRGKTGDVSFRFNLPGTEGASLVATADVASGTDMVHPLAALKLSLPNARLSYMPGSVVWRHQTTARDPFAEEVLTDSALIGGSAPLEDLLPGQSGSLTVLARVIARAVSIRVLCSTPGNAAGQWITVAPSATLDCAITGRNEGNEPLRHAVVYANLSPSLFFVPASAVVMLGDAVVPHSAGDLVDPMYPTGHGRPLGRPVGLTINKIAVGQSYLVKFQLRVIENIDRGVTRTVGVIHPVGMNEIYNTVEVTVARS